VAGAPLGTGSASVQYPLFREPAAVRSEPRAGRNKEGGVSGVGDVALRDGSGVHVRNAASINESVYQVRTVEVNIHICQLVKIMLHWAGGFSMRYDGFQTLRFVWKRLLNCNSVALWFIECCQSRNLHLHFSASLLRHVQLM